MRKTVRGFVAGAALAAACGGALMVATPAYAEQPWDGYISNPNGAPMFPLGAPTAPPLAHLAVNTPVRCDPELETGSGAHIFCSVNADRPSGLVKVWDIRR